MYLFNSSCTLDDCSIKIYIIVYSLVICVQSWLPWFFVPCMSLHTLLCFITLDGHIFDTVNICSFAVHRLCRSVLNVH